MIPDARAGRTRHHLLQRSCRMDAPVANRRGDGMHLRLNRLAFLWAQQLYSLARRVACRMPLPAASAYGPSKTGGTAIFEFKQARADFAGIIFAARRRTNGSVRSTVAARCGEHLRSRIRGCAPATLSFRNMIRTISPRSDIAVRRVLRELAACRTT